MNETHASKTQPPLLEAQKVSKHFRTRGSRLSGTRPTVHAVDEVSLQLGRQESLALVGESGSGKSTVAKLLLGLEHPTSGEILFMGSSITDVRGRSKDGFRSSVQAVFQDPLGSLDPRRTIGHSIGEPVKVIHGASPAARAERVAELLGLVGLDPSLAGNYPHELSGGMQQRVAVARALAPRPSVIVLDEPVSALDVSIKAQVMNLLKDLQEELELAYFVIAHDLATVRFLADRVAVMYLGRIVEIGEVEGIFQYARHPYTRALLEASAAKRPGVIPQVLGTAAKMGSASDLPVGCRYQARCPLVVDRCLQTEPHLEGEANHRVACHVATERA